MKLFRLAKTKNERTQYYTTTVNELDIPVQVRGRRHPKALWTVWDDHFRSNLKIRNWKKYRHHQWK